MALDPDVSAFRIGGIPIAALDMDGLVLSLRRYFKRGATAPGAYVTFCGAHGIVDAQKSRAVFEAHDKAWLAVADGRPLFWIGRLRGYRGVRQVPGIQSVEIVCRAGLASDWGHYFIGGAPGVAEALSQEMAARVPGLRVCGFESPPFRPLEPDEIREMRARIASSKAQIIWVGLGAPKQELFMAEHARHWPGTVAMGVGAAFDVNIGRMRRAPVSLQVMGLEWVYRLALEPRRLWSRYSVIVPRFMILVAMAFLRSAITGRDAFEIHPEPSVRGSWAETKKLHPGE